MTDAEPLTPHQEIIEELFEVLPKTIKANLVSFLDTYSGSYNSVFSVKFNQKLNYEIIHNMLGGDPNPSFYGIATKYRSYTSFWIGVSQEHQNMYPYLNEATLSTVLGTIRSFLKNDGFNVAVYMNNLTKE